MQAHQWIIIRHIATDELRISKTAHGYRPKMQPGYTWGGPYDTLQEAEAALRRRDKRLKCQLYPVEAKPGTNFTLGENHAESWDTSEDCEAEPQQ